MKVLIVDNQEEIRKGLKLLLEKYCPQVREIQEAEGVVSGLRKIHEYQPDLVFTDVEMDDGTGMDLLAKVPEINFQVIFITAYNKYAVDAFRFSAIDFLLKPIDPEHLIESVQRAVDNMKRISLTEQLSIFSSQYNQVKEEKKIVLKDQKAFHIVKVGDLIFMRAEGVYTEFQIVGGERIVMSKNIKEYEEMLLGQGFMRVHNSYLINLKHIHKMDRADGGTLVMTEGHNVPVSTRRKDLLLDYLKTL